MHWCSQGSWNPTKDFSKKGWLVFMVGALFIPPSQPERNLSCSLALTLTKSGRSPKAPAALLGNHPEAIYRIQASSKAELAPNYARQANVCRGFFGRISKNLCESRRFLSESLDFQSIKS